MTEMMAGMYENFRITGVRSGFDLSTSWMRVCLLLLQTIENHKGNYRKGQWDSTFIYEERLKKPTAVGLLIIMGILGWNSGGISHKYDTGLISPSGCLISSTGPSGNINCVKGKADLKSSIFWDITPCSPLKVNRRFGGTCRLHIQGRRISQARNMLLRNVGWLSTDYTALYLRRWNSS
jgi:hypothetical protein